MRFRIQKNVPMPRGVVRGGRDFSDLAYAITVLEPGDSFFIPASPEGCDAKTVQRRMTVRAVSMRKSGKISFFLRTAQTTESWEDEDGVLHDAEDGVRIWRRDARDTEVSSPGDEESDSSADHLHLSVEVN